MIKIRILWIMLLSLLLCACQGTAPTPPARPTWTVVPLPEQNHVVLVAASTPSPTPNAGTIGTGEESTAASTAAAVAARSYFQALEAGNFQAAANGYSKFSLMMAGMTREEAALELQGEMARGSRWSNLEVKETRPLDEHTILVHVIYQLERKGPPNTQATPDATEKDVLTMTQMDELWPLRLENSLWLYNRGNVIDYRLLDVPEQATGGLIIKPRQLTRFSDRIRLTLMVQNTANEAIVLGQVNEIMAMFNFKDQQVEAVKKQMIFERLRTNPQATIEVMGLYETYPDGVIIRQWKNYKVKPWFKFQFTQ